MEAVGSEQPAAPAVPSTAAADAAQNATAPPAASAEPAPRSRKEEHAAVLAALLGVPSPDAAARYQALLQLSPAPAAGGDQQQQQQQEAVVRVEYSCVDVSDRYLVCGCVRQMGGGDVPIRKGIVSVCEWGGVVRKASEPNGFTSCFFSLTTNRSNTGVVDMYAHDGRGGNCRLLKALVPPQRSRHTNVKLTCLKLGPQDRMLAVGNILGAVNVRNRAGPERRWGQQGAADGAQPRAPRGRCISTDRPTERDDETTCHLLALINTTTIKPRRR